ncbi:MAG TPA: DNA polymerase/3'-5' exonuclease PolX [Planctomycetaceae bacterium]|nr:DNA polymerase III subunit beta [Rhodopirellula sp.]HCK73137.1 DNA polymerase/3'-5' exonuclease PolX [Planctomycetaceae bacterium]HCP84739.1 DNA polymerase/3'-5' exonuclease PolX [Planctomycetaceae bacterium]
MDNAKISQTITMLADLLEFQGANAFKIRAYRNGARVIKDYPDSINSIIEEDPASLLSIDGIGKGVAEKCVVLVETGELPQINEILEEIPRSVLDLLRIPGMGPKKGAMLYRELGIANLDQLKEACKAGVVSDLKGFGAKTVESILAGIEIADAANKRVYWAKADETARQILDHMQSCGEISKIELAGSYRRRRETVGDLDILVVSENAEVVMDHFGAYHLVESVIGRGDTKMSVRIEESLQVDLRVVPADSFGAALQYFTGSKDHNVVLRGLAKQRGLKINEYGVFKMDGDKETYVAGATEEDVYAAMELPVFPPELREARREFDWAAEKTIPDLIREQDLVGDLHMHTTATDGKATLEEMVEAAQARGLSYIAITDHSQRVSMAHGLDADRLLAQWKEVDALNEKLDGSFRILKGIECDILEAGGMDLPDEVLSQGDWIIASVHYGQRQSREQITDRIVGALENPHVHIIAHPTGRLINRREAYEVDMEAVMQAAVENGKLLELNANPARLDLHDVHLAAARKYAIPIVISSDAHSVDGLDVLKYGVLQARRGGLTADDVANTKSWDAIESILGR